MMYAKLLLVGCLAILNFEEILGHGMLMEPVNRGSAYKKGFKTPINYDDDGNYCGGLSVQNSHGGKCGVCGDNYADPRPRANENTGRYGTGTIVKTYQSGQKIELIAELTANHMGFFRFAVCPLKNNKELESEECFNRYPIKLDNGSYKYTLKSHAKGNYKVTGILPAGLTCDHCVLRWEYVAGNNWGMCEDGTGRMGCGPQETFRTCSDIKIV